MTLTVDQTFHRAFGPVRIRLPCALSPGLGWLVKLSTRPFPRGEPLMTCLPRQICIFIALISLSTLTACQSAQSHRAAVQDAGADRMTVGTVQREIRVGMSGAEVAAVLGSPNIVSTDEERREVWIYDKIATDHAYSSSSGGVNALVLAIGGGGGAGVTGGFGASSGASSTTQRTLTVIIKFDGNGAVRDFAYHTSRF